MDAIKAMSTQLDYIKVRAESIIQLINEMPVSDLPNDNECADLIQLIQNDMDAMAIHLESASELVDWDKTI
jgi:hypothetical protein